MRKYQTLYRPFGPSGLEFPRAQLIASSNDRHQLHNPGSKIMSNAKRPREGGDKPKKRYRAVRDTNLHLMVEFLIYHPGRHTYLGQKGDRRTRNLGQLREGEGEADRR